MLRFAGRDPATFESDSEYFSSDIESQPRNDRRFMFYPNPTTNQEYRRSAYQEPAIEGIGISAVCSESMLGRRPFLLGALATSLTGLADSSVHAIDSHVHIWKRDPL